MASRGSRRGLPGLREACVCRETIQEGLDAFAPQMNTRPRKRLDLKSMFEVMGEVVMQEAMAMGHAAPARSSMAVLHSAPATARQPRTCQPIQTAPRPSAKPGQRVTSSLFHVSARLDHRHRMPSRTSNKPLAIKIPHLCECDPEHHSYAPERTALGNDQKTTNNGLQAEQRP